MEDVTSTIENNTDFTLNDDGIEYKVFEYKYQETSDEGASVDISIDTITSFKLDIKNKENINNNIEMVNDILNDAMKDIEIIEVEDIEDEDIQQEIISNENIEDSGNLVSDSTSNKVNIYVSPYYSVYEKTYSKLFAINSDTVGWLKVEGTNVNYPVVQSSDNNYYIEHAFDKTKNRLGWVFADYRNNFDSLSKNTIIYAHNVRGTKLMFATLKNVLEESWYTNPNNLKITFNIKEETNVWQIFSMYTLEKTSDYLKVDFSSNEQFLMFVDKLKNRSIVDFGVELTGDDNILTLSTCYNNADYRLVVHAKKIS